MTLDPIHQFNIDNFFKIGQIGNQQIYFTNSSAYMLVTVVVIIFLALGGLARQQLVPGRFQSLAELSYVFVATMVRSTAGEDGMRFFALVYSLFMFILISNLIGIIPYTFTVFAISTPETD
jgi:F-type H+-transporting ATPase subunit a